MSESQGNLVRSVVDLAMATPRSSPLKVAGLFAGIGGLELGLSHAGHTTQLLCEIDEPAGNVLATRFPDVSEVIPDVRDVSDLAGADLLTAGFPCQDLSQAGRTAGITGEQSGLVGEVFRLLKKDGPRWLLLENVPFMLQLERGKAMTYLTESLGKLGYQWAYRVVDTRSFGLPQRRQRVLLLASREEDPRPVLFGEDAGAPEEPPPDGEPCGFYWTEGVRGLGLAVNAIPTLKGGSTVGIPSPPAIWVPGHGAGLPDIRDAERLQGFTPDWTLPAQSDGTRNGPRWRLVGNAVSVPVAAWLGERLRTGASYEPAADEQLVGLHRWPKAAWGGDGNSVHRAVVSTWPRREPLPALADFLHYDTTPLSARATAGFLKRTERSKLRFPDGFLGDLREHLDRVQQAA